MFLDLLINVGMVFRIVIEKILDCLFILGVVISVIGIFTKPNIKEFKNHVKFYFDHGTDDPKFKEKYIPNSIISSSDTYIEKADYYIHDWIICRFGHIVLNKKISTFIGILLNQNT